MEIHLNADQRMLDYELQGQRGDGENDRSGMEKLLRQRWLIGIAILLIFVDVGLFLNTQYTEKKDRVAAVPLCGVSERNGGYDK